MEYVVQCHAVLLAHQNQTCALRQRRRANRFPY
jgi:hypothetical protein